MPGQATETPTASQTPTFLERFTVLRGALPELWIVFGVKLLATVAYAVMNMTFVLWLSSDLGFSDKQAGFWVGVWSAVITFFTVLVGSLTDAIGLRRAFILGVVICIFSRAVLTLTTSPWLALAGGMLPLALGEALGVPVLVAAIRRYSTTAQRSISFSIFYAMMNVGFLLAGLIFDHLRKDMGEHGQFVVLGFHFTTYRILFLISFLSELILWPVLYFGLREGVEAKDENEAETQKTPLCSKCGYNLTGNVSGRCPECGLDIEPEPPAVITRGSTPAGSFLDTILTSMRNTLRDTVRIFIGLWRQPGFYKFLAFLALAAFVRLIFIQMHYTYPKFGIRMLGEGAPLGRLWNVTNSALIIVLVPIVGALSQRISAYRMVTWGSAITTVAVFILVLPSSWFEGIAQSYLGHLIGHVYLGLKGDVNPWYIMFFFYGVVLSFGEAIFSPRLYEYAAVVAPKGQEASYMSLSYLPFLLAKLLAATPSGVLLAWYCPETGPRNPAMLWLIIALTTAIAPVGMILLRPWIRVPEAGREG